jgi:hypothetical protein
MKSCKEINLLAEAENELKAMRQEIKNDAPHRPTLSQIFYHGLNEATIQAELYHQCKIKGISCILNVGCRYGRFDAVIEINNNFYIIELKKISYSRKIAMEQLQRYSLMQLPVILISGMDYISNILNIIRLTSLDNSIYELNESGQNLIKIDNLSTE